MLDSSFAAHQTAPTHPLGKRLQHREALIPADAAIGHALAVGERLARAQILASGHQMAFNHDAEDAAVARSQLLGDVR